MDHSPKSILIVGSGVFGLATALALTQRPSFSSSTITVLDRSPFPSPDGSSIDTSRIIRADVSKLPAKLFQSQQAEKSYFYFNPESKIYFTRSIYIYLLYNALLNFGLSTRIPPTLLLLPSPSTSGATHPPPPLSGAKDGTRNVGSFL